MSGLVYLAEPIDQADPFNDIGWQLGLAVENVCDRAQCGIYRPYTAFRRNSTGMPAAASEIASVNQYALARAGALVAVVPEGISSLGVPAEIEQALSMGLPVFIVTSSALAERSVQLAAWAQRGAKLWVRTPDGQTAPDMWADQLSRALEPGAHPYGSSNVYRIQQTGPGGQIPSRGYPDDAGLDLATAATTTILPGEYACLPTDIAGQLPVGTFGLILGRSSTWAKHQLLVIPSVIDVGWRGELLVGMKSLNPAPVELVQGERVAQIIVLPAWLGMVQQVDVLAPHQRGLNGFGSTGSQ